MEIKSDKTALKDGLSGIMRVRNEGKLIGQCIDSCVNSLDELIVAYTGCHDETESVLLRKQKEYPTKLRIYKYEYDVLWYGLSKDEYQFALSLPEDDPRLYCNFCNFALKHVRYKYALKIDSDQLYFSQEIKRWRDVCAKQSVKCDVISFALGAFFRLYFSLYRRLSLVLNKPMHILLPNWLVKYFHPYYQKYAERELLKNRAVIALSGINLFIDKSIYVPFDGINIHPPYNGEGDTVIFKVSDQTYYRRHTHNTAKERENYSVTEDFNLSVNKIIFSGPVWFHLHANRSHCYDKVKSVMDITPQQFVPLSQFLSMSYSKVLSKMDPKSHTLFQRTLFAYIHKSGLEVVPDYYYLLDSLKGSEFII